MNRSLHQAQGARPIDEARVRSILRSCPSAGEGVNHWLFCAARKLHRLSIPPAEIERSLERATVNCGRDLRNDEVSRAVRNSAPEALGKTKFYRKWPQRNYEQIEAIGRSGVSLTHLRSESPEPIHLECNTERIVDAVFPGNPMICAGAALGSAHTRPREEWRGSLARQQFIVPSPMRNRRGVTADGHLSARSLDGTGPRTFLVVEFDFAETGNTGRDTPAAPMLRRLRADGITISDLCASVHLELAKLRPLALVLHSGGKSLHGWFPCTGEEEDTLRRFMRFAVSLGADTATWTRSQFVRMPGGIRDNGSPQRVLYFNPAVLNGGLK